MKQLLIIGARGFGRENCTSIMMRPDYGSDYIIKGFLDDKATALDGFDNYPPIIGPVESYQIEKDDVFFCALGSSKWRKYYTEIIKSRGGRFISFIHPTAIVHPNAKLGEGIWVSSFCVISSNTIIGDSTVILPHSNIGHDAQVGNYCTIESYSFMGGFSQVGDMVTLNTRSTILPHIKVGEGANVGAGSVVIRNVKPNITVFGVPAKKIEY
jgi:sugar O-acyltransferase (sialic acid O-acetyltransferase NeuD family)